MKKDKENKKNKGKVNEFIYTNKHFAIEKALIVPNVNPDTLIKIATDIETYLDTKK